jgi:ubiquinone/menaquinone biosynthesis C-methylase UbiE
VTLARILEPELMDDPDEAQSYDAMNHAEVNRRFVKDMLAVSQVGPRVLDLGTGTAQIPIELCRQVAECQVAGSEGSGQPAGTLDFRLQIVASDAAASMLDVARANIVAAGLDACIDLHCGDAKQLDFADGAFQSVMSNSLLHHLAEPLLALREMVRVTDKAGTIFVRDLLRPDTADEVESIVSQYARGEPPQNQQLLRQSLFAALTLDEIRAMVVGIGFDAATVSATSDRHWTFCGWR